MRNDKTRKQRAAELLKRLERGPHTRATSPEGFAETYRLWFETWIRDDLVDLVPELRKAAQESQ